MKDWEIWPATRYAKASCFRLPKSCARSKAGIIFVTDIVWIPVVPAVQIRARSRVSGHLAEWPQQTILTQVDQAIVSFTQLRVVWSVLVVVTSPQPNSDKGKFPDCVQPG